MGKKLLVLLLAVVVSVSLYGCLNKANDTNVVRGPEGEQNKDNEQEAREVEELDTDGWRVYQKRSKNLRFKFHEDWYYARDSKKEIDLGYELYVGFADNPEILEEGNPYPVEFVILPVDKKLEYISDVSYATGTESNDNFYFFATNNKDEYESVVVAMAKSLKFLDSEVMADYEDDNISFSYPKLWEQPKKGDPEENGKMDAQKSIEWLVELGLGAKSKAGQERPIFSFLGYSDQNYDDILKELKKDESIQINEEKTVNGNRSIVFTSEGQCRNLNSYIFNGSDMVELEALCAAEDDSMEEIFDRILDSFDLKGEKQGIEESEEE